MFLLTVLVGSIIREGTREVDYTLPESDETLDEKYDKLLDIDEE